MKYDYSIHYTELTKIKNNNSETDIKRTYGLLTLINNERFNILDEIKSNITPNKFFNKKNSNPDRPYKKKKVLIINVELKSDDPKNHVNFSIANTHLTGNESRDDIRLAEINKIIELQSNCKFKYNNIIVGDFNHTNFNDVKKSISIYNYNMIDDYFNKDDFKTSFHRFNIKDWKNKKKKCMRKVKNIRQLIIFYTVTL